MSFCPVCGAHHDPNIPCADRAGELLRDAGATPKPMKKKDLTKTIRKANRGLLVLLIAVLTFFLITLLLPYSNFFRVDRRAARDDIISGNAWVQKGDYDRAIADYSEAITSKRLSKRDLSVAYYDRAMAWYSKEDYDKSIADIGEALRLDPSSTNYYARGFFWYQKGDYGKALSDYDQAIRIYPQYAGVYMSRAIVRFNMGDFSSAASDLVQSQQYKADIFAAIWLYLAREHDNRNGNAELIVNTRGLDTDTWPGPVVKLFLGKTNPNTITAQAEDSDVKRREEQICETNFFLGEWHLLHKREGQARMLLAKAQHECPKQSFMYLAAISELQRLVP